jgi:hypothetical protein
MNMFKKVLALFLSLRTTLWLLISLFCLFVFGAILMPARAEFEQLYMQPLFAWMINNSFMITWWLWGCVAILAFLTANTIACSIESLVRRRSARQWLLIISPQVVHIGFLFILLAHFLSSYGGYKATAFAYQNTVLSLPNGVEVMFKDLRADISPAGYITDWSANVQYFEEGRHLRDDVIMPNSPSFVKGLGIYIKTVRAAPFPVAFIEISREPGAVWALLGAVFFISGMIILLLLKIRREDAARAKAG